MKQPASIVILTTNQSTLPLIQQLGPGQWLVEPNKLPRRFTPRKVNAVLDFIDVLNATDISTAPDINWPEMPLAAAS
ncbi:tail fiber assembly protein [Salmonella enterica]|uniref:tail fiber assembly protein n=1 Tax=Salmonella enterica TaxID=28901 RepID=UPI002553C064|nr:tail fiber assembly protein [Salmonella enterica]WIS89619.1 tail fiber assembly protein [Salmonella enterica subsp. enterica serovar Typhi]